MSIENIKYEQIMPLQFTDELIAECADLYSNHYGTWSDNAPNVLLRGKNVKLSPSKIRAWFDNQKSSLYIAKLNDVIIGYAISMKIRVPWWKGGVSWVTQLVVHKDYRNEDVAKNILYSIWCESSNYAWGIISANPYAVRALEKATRRRSNPKLISENIEKIIEVGRNNLPYLDNETEYIVDSTSAKVNTRFFVDHSLLSEMVKRVVTSDVPWVLGELEEGWEWIAFTFNKQKQIELSSEEINDILSTSEMINQQAYERMQLTTNHSWMKHTAQDVDFIYRECNLSDNMTVYDFGCGIGRHSISLAKKRLNVIGVDYIKNNVNVAISKSKGLENVSFINDDCRSVRFDKKADAIICLYDVIGSFADESENIKIIKNIYDNLKNGGTAIITVMNYEMTCFYAKHKFKFSVEPNALLNLAASQTMEKTGDVFNPDYYLVDEETKIVYRKERFDCGSEIPAELFVRDKRYEMKEIIDICEDIGFKVDFARYVNARNWNNNLDSIDKSAKEILLKCSKI